MTTVCFGNEGLQCDFRTQTCQPPAALEQGCAYDDGCVAGAFCANGVCAAAKADGSACTSSRQCLTQHCIFQGEATSGTCGAESLATPNACSGKLFD